MTKRILIALLACAALAHGQTEMYPGTVSDITWSGSGTEWYGSFGAPAPAGWTDPNTYVALWEFETTNTTQTLDTSGNSHHASNMPSVATGPAWTILGTNQYARVEYGYLFDNVDDYLTVPDNAAWTLETNLTIGAWFKTSYAGLDTKAIMSHFNTGSPYAGWACDFNSDDKYRIEFYNSAATSNRIYSSTALNDGAWHHVAITYDGATAKIYIDGTQNVSVAMTGSVPDSTVPLRIGRRSLGSSDIWDGLLDNTMILGYPMSSNAVYTMFQYTSPPDNVRIR